MNKQQLINFLQVNPGYQKKGVGYLSHKFNLPHDVVKSALKDTREPFNTPKVVNTEYEEFLQWKASKRVIEAPVKSKGKLYQKGIHLVLPCVHVPFHNRNLVNSIVKFSKDYKNEIKGLHIIGDFLDLNSLSKHDTGRATINNLTLGKEYKEGNKVLDILLENLSSNIDKSYLYGNHEDRYNRHVSEFENSKVADALISPREALKLDTRGFDVYENWKESYIQLGKLQLIHGIYCTSTPAKTHLNRLKSSIMFAHTHRIDSYYEKDMGAFNIGTMCDIDSEAFRYMSRIERMNWKNGFGLVHLDNDGSYQADIINYHNNKFWYGGRSY